MARYTLTNYDEVLGKLKDTFESVVTNYNRLIVNGKPITGGLRLYENMTIFCKPEEVADLLIKEIKIQLCIE